MKIRIGTRSSPLALAQAREVQARLAAAHDIALDDLPIIKIQTSGDRIQNRSLSEIGGKGLFTKEIEEALYARDIDVAVHSAKDLETEMPDGLQLVAMLPREDVRDAFISLRYKTLSDLPENARIGTSSVRRRAQVLHVRPDLTVVEFRGNVQTRLQKLADNVADATFLACAGLNRLAKLYPDQAGPPAVPVAPAQMRPAVGQGAIGLQMRADDDALVAAVSALDDYETHVCVAMERVFLRTLDGSCRTPIAALAQWQPQAATADHVNGGGAESSGLAASAQPNRNPNRKDELRRGSVQFDGEILNLDGTARFTTRFNVPVHIPLTAADLSAVIDAVSPHALAAGEVLKEEAGEEFFRSIGPTI